MINKRACLIIIVLTGLAYSSLAETTYPGFKSNWIELLKNGTSEEKKLALYNFRFLAYGDQRKDSKDFAPVLNALDDKNPSVRAAAANILKHIGEGSKACCKDTEVVPSLVKALRDSSPLVRQEAAKALAYYKDRRAIDPLIEALKDKEPWVRLNAAFSLGEVKEHTAVAPLIALLEGNSDWPNKFVQQEALSALRKIGVFNYGLITLLIKKNEDEYLRAEIIETFARFPSIAAREVILAAINDPNEKIRKLAVKAISQLPTYGDINKNGSDQKIESLIKALKDPSADVRANSAEELGKTRNEKSVIPLIELLRYESDDKVQRSTIEALGKFRDDKVFAVLAEYISKWGPHEEFAEQTFRSLAENTATKKINKKIPYGSFEQLVNKPATSALLTAVDSAHQNSKWRITMLLGGFEDERIVTKLTKLLDDPSTDVRKWAVYSLGRRVDEDIVPIVLSRLRDEEPKVREEAARVLGNSGDKRALEPLFELLKDRNSNVRLATLSAIGNFNAKSTIEPLLHVLKDDNDAVRAKSIAVLGNFDDRRITDVSLKLLDDQSIDVKIAAINNIARKRDQRAFEAIMKILENELMMRQDGTRLKYAAIKALGAFGDKRAVPLLIKASEQKESRMAAINALCLIKAKESVPILIKYLSDNSVALETRRQALLVIGEIGDYSAIEALEQLINDKKNHMVGTYGKYVFVEAIGKISSDKAVQILIKALDSSESFGEVNSGIRQLEKFKNKQAIKPLLKLVGKNKTFSFNVAGTLKQYGDPLMTNTIVGHLNDADTAVKKGAIIILGEFREKKAVEPLETILDDKDPDIKALAKEALSYIEPAPAPKPQTKDFPSQRPRANIYEYKVFATSTSINNMKNGSNIYFASGYPGFGVGGITEGKIKKDGDEKDIRPETMASKPVKGVDIQPLIARTKDEDAKIKREAADALGDSGNIKASKHLIPALKDKDAYVRQAAARSLGKLKAKDAVSGLIEATKDSDISVRSFSIWALGEIQDIKAIESLANLLLDKEEKIRDQSFDALRKYSDPVARRSMVKKLIMSSISSASYILLSRLMSIEGEQVLLKALEDPDGNDAKTIRSESPPAKPEASRALEPLRRG